MPIKKIINEVEFEIDYINFKAKVLNPIDINNLENEHIYTDTQCACLTLSNEINIKAEFNKQLEIWSHKHLIYKIYGVWYQGHSHNRAKAMEELVYKILNTNSYSVKRLIKVEGFLLVIKQILISTTSLQTMKEKVFKKITGKEFDDA